MPDDREFREKVLTTLTSIDTKMDTLVGTDGVKGRVPQLEEKVDDLEAHKNRALGIMAALGSIGAALLGLGEWFVHRKP